MRFPYKEGVRCKVGSPTIDEALEGGIRCGMITELFGEGGCGKTQMCLQLALSVQLSPNLGGLYGVQQFRDALWRNKCVGEEVVNLENIVLCKVEDCKELCFRLGEMRRECLQRSETDRLVIIDCIASLFRSQFVNTKDGMTERKSYFKKITGTLRGYAEEFNMAVLITNQVTDVVVGTSAPSTRSNIFESVYGHLIQPSLASSWAAGLTNRIFLGISSERGNEDQVGDSKRFLRIIFSEYMQVKECNFVITRDGIV